MPAAMKKKTDGHRDLYLPATLGGLSKSDGSSSHRWSHRSSTVRFRGNAGNG